MKKEVLHLDEKKILEDYDHIISRLIIQIQSPLKEAYENLSIFDALVVMPIKFKLYEIDLEAINQNLPEDEAIKQEHIAIGGFIYRDTEAGNPNRAVVFLTLTKDVKHSWEEFFNLIVSKPTFRYAAAFVYMHESMHILLKHYNYHHQQLLIREIENIKGNLPSAAADELVNLSQDFWINSMLIEQAAYESSLKNYLLSDAFTGIYNKNLKATNYTETETAKIIAEETTVKSQEIRDNIENNIIGWRYTITFRGKTKHYVVVGKRPETSELNDLESEYNENIQEFTEILESARREIIEKTKGSGSQEVFAKLGINYEVPTDWFNHLKTSVFQVTQRYTSHYEQTWGKIKNKYRHIAKLPGRIYKEKSLSAIISIDQSGSMSDIELEKINYIVTELAKKAKQLTILIHDTDIQYVKTFKNADPAIKNTITVRRASGGTSHKQVFRFIQEEKIKNPKEHFIYLSFSDNYSDIEQYWSEELFDKKVTPYWITTAADNTVDVPGMQISLDKGILKM